MRKIVNRTCLITVVAAALMGAGATAATAHPTPPGRLSGHLLPPRLLPGYHRIAPPPRPLDLRAFSRAAGLDPRSKAKLARSGFVRAMVETLAGPQPIPPQAGTSTSNVIRFHDRDQARRFEAWIVRTYEDGPPPPGIHVRRFDIPAVPTSVSIDYFGRTPNGRRLDEYDTLFTSGRYLHEEDIFTLNQQLTKHRFSHAVTALYHDVTPISDRTPTR